MSTDIRTRRLIVTLPDASDEEVDTLAADLNTFLDEHPVGEIATALRAFDGESFSRHFTTMPGNGHVLISVWQGEPANVLGPDEARKLASLLLRAADEAEDKS